MNPQSTEITEENKAGYDVASTGDRWKAFIFTLSAVPVFTVGFIPTSRSLYRWLASFVPLPVGHWADQISFPLLAIFFHLSFRSRQITPPFQRWNRSTLLLICVLPLLVSFCFGRVHPGTPSWWNLVFVPIGEECLFRGWFYTLFDKQFRGKLFTATNPLPVGIWASAMAFSLWHLQNLGTDPWGFVLFQVGYTFLVGIWLGVLRWHTGNIAVPIALHTLLNAASCPVIQ